MILYCETKQQFDADVCNNSIEQKILDQFERRLGRRTGRSEILSWQNSMQYMNNILSGAQAPLDSTVAIEYKIPISSRRIDFILAGRDQDERDSILIVELKQWENASKTEKDGIVSTQLTSLLGMAKY